MRGLFRKTDPRSYCLAASLPVTAALAFALRDQGGATNWLAWVQLSLLIGGAALLAQPSSTMAIRRLGSDRASWLFVSWWAWLAATMLWSVDSRTSAHALWALGTIPAVVLMVLWAAALPSGQTAAAERTCTELWRPLVALAIALASWGLFEQLYLGQEPKTFFLHRHGHAAFLNLLVLPMGAWALSGWCSRSGRSAPRLFALACFGYCVFAIAGSGGRASTLGLGVGLLFLFVGTRGLVPARAAAILALTVALAYAAAEVTLDQPLRASLARTVEEAGASSESVSQGAPHAATVSQRLLLWRQTMRLLEETPWYGAGPGVFWMVFSPHRTPMETTGGYHAHNDYLELLVEIGWPGALLFVAMLAAVLRRAWRACREQRLTPGLRLEAAGLGAALACVSAHALVSFPYYILSIAVLSALCMGRILVISGGASTQLGSAAGETAPASLRQPGNEGAETGPAPASQHTAGVTRGGRRPARVVLGLPIAILIGWGLFHQVAALWGQRLIDTGVRAKAEREFVAAEQSFRLAYRLSADDRALAHLLSLYAGVMQMPTAVASDLFVLFERGRFVAQELERLRPRSAHAHAAIARFHASAGQRVAAASPRIAAVSFARALSLNPRAFGVRREYAELLRSQGSRGEALAVVDEGLRWPIGRHPQSLPFLGLATRTQLEAGRLGSARQVYALVREIMQEFDVSDSVLDTIGLTPLRRHLDG